jgi:dipeptidyl aminopeptidase/acylaminoacyl peptidase
MHCHSILYFLLLSTILAVTPTLHAERLTPEKLFDLARIGEAAVSPDGSQVAYLVTRFDLEENSSNTDLFLQDMPQPTGDDGREFDTADQPAIAFETPMFNGSAESLLTGISGLQGLHWIKRPSGPQLLFIAPANLREAMRQEDSEAADDGDTDKSEEEDADGANSSQAWMLDPASGELKLLTDIEDGIGNLKPAPTGDRIAFTVDVKLDKPVQEMHSDLPKADARIIDSLLYRHWNAWHDYAYSHLHVVDLDEQGETGEPLDLMPGMKADCPIPPFGGAEQFAFSPDGQEIALTLKLVNNPAESTDTNVYLVSVDGGPLQNITPGMPGYDMEPRYSPDGKTIAFHSMRRAGFESDRNRIMIYDRSGGGLREITEGLDQTTHGATWSQDSQRIYFYSETRGTTQVYAIDVRSGELQQISTGRFEYGLESIVPDSKLLLVRQQNMLRPTELALIDVESRQTYTLTNVNGKLYQQLELPRIEQRYFTATDGKQIHNWVILPPDYDEDSDRKWPMLTYCQGGPQGQIGQWFSYRWNFHLMAAKGYVVLAVNRRGLPGFGREWNDQISGDWGGQAMQDILASTDGMLADPKIDRERVAAVGASFGGYTVYWLMGNSDDRFCAMIAHCGVYNLESMYGSTEELFFVNWDLGGPYWESQEIAEQYRRFSPHRFAGNWETPLLIIHGEKDFRVPLTQAMEAFTAAQTQGVPSRFLYFPQEGHWVLSPQNSVLWGRVFFDWLDSYCQPDK